MIWQRQWNDPSSFHDALRAEILQRAEAAPPPHQDGWRSAEDFLDWPLVAVDELRARMRAALVDIAPSRRDGFQLRAWAVVNYDGSYHKRHVHGSSVWSGIYYVDPGGDCACAVFETLKEPIRITPVPSLMVVFPSTAWHRVEAHRSTGTRITIAFDAR